MTPAATTFSPVRIARFSWSHAWMVLLAPVLVVFGTLVHELAHGLAAVLQGAEIYDIQLLPSGDKFGSISHSAVAHPGAVMVAPVIVWTLIASTTLCLLHLVRRDALAKLAFVSLFLLPLADISMSVAGLVGHRANADLYRALAGLETEVAAVTVVAFVLFGIAGWRALKPRVDGKLSGLEYALGYTALLALPFVWF